MLPNLSIEQLQAILYSAPTALLGVARDGTIVFSNKLACDYFLYDDKALKGLPLNTLIPAASRKHHPGLLEQYFAAPKPRAMGEGRKLTALRSDAHEFPIEIGLNQILLDGMPVVIASIVNISQRRKLEGRYELALQLLPEGLLIVSEAGSIVEANIAAQNMFGYTRAELLGSNIDVLVPQRYRTVHQSHRAGFIGASSSRRMGIAQDLYARRKDGSEFPVEIGLNPLATDVGLEVTVTVIDISSRRQMEKERQEFELKIQQTQKLESLGVLAGGIAHDFNNLLTGVVGNAELTLMKLPPDSPLKRHIESILNASMRAAELCEQMLAYTGKSSSLKENLSLNETIRSTLELIGASISKSTQLKLSLRDDLPAVFGDATQIRQVIMNLVINASEAIGDRTGQISLTTGVMEYDPGRHAGFTPYEEDIAKGVYVFLTVTDNGGGIASDDLGKIFEPFYSTKFTGRGLGLSAVLGIVRSHGGTIRIHSEPGTGTAFRVLLPFEGGAATNPDDEFDGRARKPTGNVLVIDDEAEVRQVIADSLKTIGLQSISAADGREGLQVFASGHYDFVLVITDLTMPHLGGEGVLRKIRETNATIPVILTSGYAEGEIRQRFAGAGISGFLAKPLRPSELVRVVADCLDGQLRSHPPPTPPRLN